jgi:hypothetical protein
VSRFLCQIDRKNFSLIQFEQKEGGDFAKSPPSLLSCYFS